jgi:membrane protein DedA with SNARE-associated domain
MAGMHHAGTLLVHFLTISQPLAYFFVFAGMLVEGDLSLLAIASLIRLGYFEPFGILFFVLSGAFLSDVFWFWLGRKSRLSTNRRVQWLLKKMEIVTVDIHKNFFWKLFISKFMYGTHRPFLVSIGSSPLSFRKFILNDIPAVLGWVGIIGGLGYVFTTFIVRLRHVIKYAEVGIIIMVVLYLGISYVLKKEVHIKE